MRSKRLLLALLLLLLVALLAGPISVAQDPAPAEAPGRSGDAAQDELESFDPSEKVPAETAVAFPVDI